MDITNKTPTHIQKRILSLYPEIQLVYDLIEQRVKRSKREIAPYQAAALYVWAKQFNDIGARALEVGSAYGYSAQFLCNALPDAEQIICINPKEVEYPHLVKAVSLYPNCQAVKKYSYQFLESYQGAGFDFIFIDGDHTYAGVKHDLQFFNLLRVGGLMVFHDYSPNGSKRPCQDVVDVVNEFCDYLGRDFDERIIDNDGVGMVGFYRADGENYEAT